MGESPKAKLFMHGGSQAVRLPKAFRFDGAEVRIRKEGDKVILEPLKPVPQSYGPEFWVRIDALREAAGEDFPDRPEQPEDRVLSFDE